MTENLAGRGEGLAGLREQLIVLQLEHETSYSQLIQDKQTETPWTWHCLCGAHKKLADWNTCHKATREHWADVILAALEAAAPPSTARTIGCTASDDCIHECPVSEPESRLDEFKTTVIALWDPELTPEQKKAYIASRGKELREAAALATPSPQAPTKSVESQVTSSDAAQPEMGDGSLGKVSVPQSQPAATQEQPAGSGASESGAISITVTGIQQVAVVMEALRASGLRTMEGIKIMHDRAGSPRKVGEDGASERVMRTALLAIVNMAHRAWEDKASVETMFRLIGKRAKGALELARPSSVPVGEQKQEEGV